MACAKREQTGDCGHFQCLDPEISGYECVDVTAGVCEIGDDCPGRCRYATRLSIEPEMLGSEIIRTKGKVDEQTCPDCGQILQVYRVQFEDDRKVHGLPISAWLAFCGKCQVGWEAMLEVVSLQRIK